MNKQVFGEDDDIERQPKQGVLLIAVHAVNSNDCYTFQAKYDCALAAQAY
jgi:hypothetical protein